jgi:hypothetical protein
MESEFMMRYRKAVIKIAEELTTLNHNLENLKNVLEAKERKPQDRQ